jgi:membrane-bound metal-dependent hydrolase YbcI (DUF457 family)
MDPLMHVLLPSLILIAFGWERKILKWSFVAFLPDMLYLTTFHRNLSHSFVVLGIISAVLYYAMKDKRLAVALVFFLLSHPLLDMGGYVAVLYPITDSYYKLHSDIILQNPSKIFLFDTWIETAPPGELEQYYDSYLLKTSTAIYWLLLATAYLLVNRQKIIKGIRTVVKQ